MKKILYLFSYLIISLIFTSSVFAQSKISAGAGTGTIPEVMTGLRDALWTPYSFGIITSKNESNTAAFFISYQNYLSKRFSLGGSFVYQKFSNNLYFLNNEEGTESDTWYTFLAVASYKYVDAGWFGLAAELEAGGTVWSWNITYPNGSSSQNSNVHLGLQITPLLFSFGRTFGVNIGIGFGFKGIVFGNLYYLF